MTISSKTIAERILLALFVGVAAGVIASGTASAAGMTDMVLADSTQEGILDAAPSPGSAPLFTTDETGEYLPSSARDSAMEELTPEQRLDQLQAEIVKLQEQLAGKEDKPEPSKKFKNNLGGILIMDAITVDQSGGNKEVVGDVDNYFPIREARFCLKGTGYDVVNYECTVAVQTSNSQRANGLLFKNIMVGVKDVPVLQNIKVGHFKVETCMSERDLLINSPGISYFSGSTTTFSPHRHYGVGATQYYADKRLRVYNGLYSGRSFTDSASVLDDAPGLILNTRVTAIPYLSMTGSDDLHEIVHLGGSAYWYIPGNEQNVLKMRARPTSWCGGMKYLLNSAIPLEKGYSVYTGEVAWQRGQFGVSSENYVASIKNYGTSWGTNLAARYFLTPGSYRTYNYNSGGFGNAHLAHPFSLGENFAGGRPDSLGELELAFMYAYWDLNNLKNVPSTPTVTTIYGDLHEVVFGVNWWWSPDIRWSAAYTKAYCNSAQIGEAKQKTSNNTVNLQVSLQF
ncbi:MAG: porin [Thermoguttaceae bacterium]|jgi:phosphate-selective porin